MPRCPKWTMVLWRYSAHEPQWPQAFANLSAVSSGVSFPVYTLPLRLLTKAMARTGPESDWTVIHRGMLLGGLMLISRLTSLPRFSTAAVSGIRYRTPRH